MTHHRWLCIAFTAAGLGIVQGCGQGSADQQVRMQLDDARVKAAEGTTESLEQARKIAESASVQNDLSDVTKTQAEAALGQIHMDAAMQRIAEFDQKQLAASRLALDIAELGRQIGLSNVLVEGYQLLDPARVRTDIAQKIADAQGGPDKPTWVAPQGKSSVPTLAALQQQISQTEGQIAQKQSQIQQLQQQRQQTLEQADQFARQSESAKGQQSVDLYKQASDARRKASDTATQIDVITASILPLQKDLSISQGQQQILQSYIKDLQDQQQTLDTGWQAIQQQIAAQLALAKQIATVDAMAAGATTMPVAASEPALQASASPELQAPGKSIVTKVKALADLSKQIEDLGKAAADDLDNAAKAFDQAFTTANKADAALRTLAQSPNRAYEASRPAFQLQQQAIWPQQYRLAQARALRILGSLEAARAANLAIRVKLRDMVSQAMVTAKLAAPAELGSAELNKQLQDALGAADEAFKTADERLTDVIDNSAQGDLARDAQKAARVAQIFVRYGQSQLALIAGNAQQAQAAEEKAREAVKLAVDNEAALPALPASLQSAIPAPASTQPAAPGAEGAATQPATAPAGAAPTTAPATPGT
jgi:hypothetical protein